MNQPFQIEKKRKTEMIERIQHYFMNQRNEELGDLAASLVLDFFMDELAPLFYNLGVEDAHAFLTEKLDDLYEIQRK
ncbi:DUF2164 domain-containing protein [Aquibacillus sp. 3ASR75-11]|uniref:DUF2164 domain-containing protein n=1 Tax=Terrihalobacillus insolitus TaxID=2950438 RepID=A0A9X4AMB3_9BACI|nr:DUF2164 domain-containing protein [Terrihalobacillus insolitus]MDC3413467.1 DUF2164 domain-containing protein [Terrihalobacillus insolitus]MDC3425242.1 DUF2164 domain-containing protein [Terrihalobacillus insolitus]